MINAVDGSIEGERDVAVTMLPLYEELTCVEAALDAVDMDRVTPEYDVMQQGLHDAVRSINQAHSELYARGYAQKEVINGTGKAIGIVRGYTA